MSWTAPRTWVTGEVVTSSLFNTHIRDNQLSSEHPHGSVETSEQGPSNTTTETSLFGTTPTIAASDISATGTYTCFMLGRARQGTTSSLTWRWRVKLGATTVLDTTAIAGGAATATEVQFRLECIIQNLDSESSQRVFLHMQHNGQYVYQPFLHGTSAVATTSSLVFDITLQLGTAGANDYLLKQYSTQSIRRN